MADSKITALTAISTVDPTADPLVIVDVSDTSMAASGTTKKSTINQLLGSGGTATLASATITGDLTVDTNVLKVDTTLNRVGILTASPDNTFQVGDGSADTRAFFFSNNDFSMAVGRSFANLGGYIGSPGAGVMVFSSNLGVEQYRITAPGIFSWSDGAGGTRMTLNATGLGVGTVPANGIKLASYVTTAGVPATSGTTQSAGSLRIGAASTAGVMDMGTNGSYSWIQPCNALNLATNYDLVLNPNGGNVGIGVTPSAWAAGGNIQGTNGFIWSSYDASIGAGYYYASGSYKYISTAAASIYAPFGGTHKWFTAAGGQPAGTNFTPTQAMTLDASGNLILLSSNTPATLTTNGQLTVNATSNTNLRFSYRGSDGTTRVANITLA